MQTQAQKTEVRPSTQPYSELLDLREHISSQLSHWHSVLQDASANVSGLEDRKKAADAIIEDSTATLGMKDRARIELDRLSFRLKQQQNRVSVANIQIASLAEKDKAFPTARFKQLQVEEAKRERQANQLKGADLSKLKTAWKELR